MVKVNHSQSPSRFSQAFESIKGFFRGKSVKKGKESKNSSKPSSKISTSNTTNLETRKATQKTTFKASEFADKLTQAEKKYLAKAKEVKGLEKLSDLSEGRKNLIQLWRKEGDFTQKARREVKEETSTHQNSGYYRRNTPGGTEQFQGYPQRDTIYSDEKVSGSITLGKNPKGSLYYAASTDSLTDKEEKILKALSSRYTEGTAYSELHSGTSKIIDAVRSNTLSPTETQLISDMGIEITDADHYEVE